jgi:hypothetical protein
MSNVAHINAVSDLRRRAEEQLDRIAFVEHATHLLPLALRLRRHQPLFDRHDLFLAFENNPHDRHPGIYLLKRNRSAGCRIWICYDQFRIDSYSQSSWADDARNSPHCLFSRELSIDLAIAEQSIVIMLQRGEIIFGNGYIPGALTTDLEGALRALPNINQRQPAALPPPTIELKAVEVKPRTPPVLRAVPLLRKPLR